MYSCPLYENLQISFFSFLNLRRFFLNDEAIDGKNIARKKNNSLRIFVWTPVLNGRRLIECMGRTNLFSLWRKNSTKYDIFYMCIIEIVWTFFSQNSFLSDFFFIRLEIDVQNNWYDSWFHYLIVVKSCKIIFQKSKQAHCP